MQISAKNDTVVGTILANFKDFGSFGTVSIVVVTIPVTRTISQTQKETQQ